jgi:hypothetical protein
VGNAKRRCSINSRPSGSSWVLLAALWRLAL